MPLVEIVSRPDIRSAEQARQYVNELRAILVAVGASDAKMEEGSMRVDANVSVHRPGEPLGTRCEIKNLNSVRSLGRAIEYEARRQIDLLESGEEVRQETRHWDEGDGRTHTLRSKEDADDYRYFLEPDLVPLVPDDEWVERVRAELPMLPAARRERLAAATGAAVDAEAVGVVVERGQDDYVLAVGAAGGDPARALVHVKEAFADQGQVPAVPAGDLAALTKLEVGGRLTATQAKQVLAELVAAGGGDPAAIAAAKGFEAMEASALEALVDQAIAVQRVGLGEVRRRRGQGDRRAGGRRHEGITRSGRRRRRDGTAAQQARLNARFSRRWSARRGRPRWPRASQRGLVEVELDVAATERQRSLAPEVGDAARRVGGARPRVTSSRSASGRSRARAGW